MLTLPHDQTLRRRFWTTTFYLARTLFEIWWWEFFVPHRLRLGILVRDAPERRQRWAHEYRAFALRLGGVWIKLGQFFSARADILPPDITAILADLQDEVQPVPWPAIEAQIVRELGGPPEAFFVEFVREPRAAASLGQVHFARLPTGEPVAIKVQRPGIRATIEVDLEALRWAMSTLKGFSFIRRRANLNALFDEFAAVLRQELDYIAEGRHAEQFAENFASNPNVDLPKVYWQLTTLRLLTLERIEGIKINHYAALEQAGIDRAEVAKRVFNAYLKQVFEDGFFHADPHPGNLFIRPRVAPPPAPTRRGQPEAVRGTPFDLVFIDFGAVAHISEQSRGLMRRMVIATVQRDYAELVRLAKELGFLLPEADNRALVLALETLFDRFYGLNMVELAAIDFEEIEQLSRQFRDLIYSFPFQIPQDFIWLGRTLSILSGIATGLDPAFSPIEELQPFARRLVGAEAGNLAEDALREASELAALFFALPRRLERLLRRIEDGEITREATDPLAESMAGIEGAINRLTDTMLMMTFSAGWFLTRDEEEPLSHSAPLMLLASAWVLWRMIRGRR